MNDFAWWGYDTSDMDEAIVTIRERGVRGRRVGQDVAMPAGRYDDEWDLRRHRASVRYAS